MVSLLIIAMHNGVLKLTFLTDLKQIFSCIDKATNLVGESVLGHNVNEGVKHNET